MAIVDYVKVARPQMIILENVKNCPWDELVKRWNDIGYLAVHADVDTKDFYIPQTRVRGYMLCVDKQGLDPDLEKSVMGDWVALLSRFKRRASSPAGMFLLDDDDPQLEKIETDLATRILSHGPRVPACWKKYQKHHNAHRDHNKLGHRRPVTNSEDHVTCKMPDFAWHTWAGSAVERVWDTLDINFLRKLQIGVDINYKEYVMRPVVGDHANNLGGIWTCPRALSVRWITVGMELLVALLRWVRHTVPRGAVLFQAENLCICRACRLTACCSRARRPGSFRTLLEMP